MDDMSRQQPEEHHEPRNETADTASADTMPANPAAAEGPQASASTANPATPLTTRAHRHTATFWAIVWGALAVVCVIVGIVIGGLMRSGADERNGSGETSVVATQHGSGTTVTLPSFYGDNMVVQRDEPFTIRGTVHAATSPESTESTESAEPAAFNAFNVRAVSADGMKEAVTHVNDDGTFTAEFTPTAGSQTPYVIEFRDGATPVHVLANVVFGDVFLASGQSNMELNVDQYYGDTDAQQYNLGGQFTMNDLPKPLVDADVRFVAADRVASDVGFPARAVTSGRWLPASDAQQVRPMSLLAQQFAAHVRQAQPLIPVGVVQTAWGGTPIARHEAGGDIYASHIKPLRGMRFAGVLWYQGCADASRAADVDAYTQRMVALINQYRDDFDDADLPFLYVQLARYATDQDFRGIRQRQLDTLGDARLANPDNVAMTVAIDTDKGTDAVIHPLGKDVLGARMAAQWLAMTRGEAVPNGPIIEKATTDATKPGTVRLRFVDGTTDALNVRVPRRDVRAGVDDIATPTTGTIEGFEVAGSDGVFVPARAAIDGDGVVLRSDTVDEIRAVRYLYANDPQARRLLYNDALPASPFIIDVS